MTDETKKFANQEERINRYRANLAIAEIATIALGISCISLIAALMFLH